MRRSSSSPSKGRDCSNNSATWLSFVLEEQAESLVVTGMVSTASEDAWGLSLTGLCLAYIGKPLEKGLDGLVMVLATKIWESS